MAVREPDFLGLLVHLLDKGRLAAGQAFGQHDAGVVAGLDDHAADQIGNLDAAAERHEHFRPAGAPGPFADRQFVIELGAALLQIVEDHIGRHQLRHRRGRNAFVGVLVEQNRAGLDLHDQGRAGLRIDRADGFQRDRRFRLAGRRGVVGTRLRRGDGGRDIGDGGEGRHGERGGRGYRTKPAQCHFASSPSADSRAPVALRPFPASPSLNRSTRRASGIPLSASFASRCRASVSLATGPSLTRYRSLPLTLTRTTSVPVKPAKRARKRLRVLRDRKHPGLNENPAGLRGGRALVGGSEARRRAWRHAPRRSAKARPAGVSGHFGR